MQRLTDGPLTRLLPAASALWLDGGHNQAAGAAVATAIADLRGGRPLHLVCGMLANKDAAGFLAPLARQACSLTAVPIHGHARSDEHTSELQSLMRRSYAVFCLKRKNRLECNSHEVHPDRQ